MIFIFEGMDNCLKDTLIMELRKQLAPESQVLKYSNPPKVSNQEEYQKKHFRDMFSLLVTSLSTSSRNIILNRAHLGEYVYAPIYRKYEAEWIFDLEAEFIRNVPELVSATKLLLFYDSNNDQLKKRDDHKSFSLMKDYNIDDERKRFREAFKRSHFKIKLEFDLSEYLIVGETDHKKEINVNKILEELT